MFQDLSYQRFKTTAPKTPIETDDWGWPLCRQCKEPVPLGRKTFCSDRCVREWRIQTDPIFIRQEVLKRDKGICAKCGINCLLLREEIFQVTGDFFGTRTQWEANHIVGVGEGGGECDLDNYETLCLSCHATETKSQQARRNAHTRLKREKQILLYLHDEDFGALTQEIIDAVEMSKSQTCEYLKVLKEKGLVSQNKRGAPFFITKEGIHTLKLELDDTRENDYSFFN